MLLLLEQRDIDIVILLLVSTKKRWYYLIIRRETLGTKFNNKDTTTQVLEREIYCFGVS